LLVTLLLLARFISLGDAQEAKLAVRLEPERPQCIVGEPVRITVSIVNTSQGTVLIPISWEPGDRLLVDMEHQGRITRGSPFVLPATLGYEEVHSLEPGSGFHRTFAYMGSGTVVKEPGKYRVRAIFQSEGKYLSREGTYKECWKGKVMSEWVEFEIVEPKTDADKAAYALLTDKGAKDIWKSLATYGHDKAPIETFEKVMEKYPTSAYARIACETLAKRYRNRSRLSGLRQCRKFAEEHWREEVLIHIIDSYIAECLAAAHKREDALALIAQIKARTDNVRVRNHLRNIVRGYLVDETAPKPPLTDDSTVQQREPPAPKVPTPSRQPEPARGPALPWYAIVMICLAIVGAAVGLYLALVHRRR